MTKSEQRRADALADAERFFEEAAARADRIADILDPDHTASRRRDLIGSVVPKLDAIARSATDGKWLIRAASAPSRS